MRALIKDLHHLGSHRNYQVYQTSRKKEFVAIVLNPKYETFIVYVVSLSSNPLIDVKIHLSRRP